MSKLNLDLTGVKTLFTQSFGVRSETSLELCAPGLRFGPVPIKRDSKEHRNKFDYFIARCLTHFERRQYTVEKHVDWLKNMTLAVESLHELDPDQLIANRVTLAQKMKSEKLSEELLDQALAHAVVSAEKTLGMVPRPNQYLSARAMLQGHFVEMATGEGKTLSVAMAAGAIALSGTPIHVLTANDYLAERDAAELNDFYAFLGLRVASTDSSQEPNQRRKSYQAQVVYVTAKQVAFDWLNDTLEMGSESNALSVRLSPLINTNSNALYEPMLRGLCLAIVDEADSLLIDEARIPLVLASNVSDETDEKTEAVVALGLAEQLRESTDYIVLSSTRHVRLTDEGRKALAKLSSKVTHIWGSSRYREERVIQALTALHLFELDRDYIVHDGKLNLMDAHTGRSMTDRRLPHGLHTLLELKEKCTPTPQHETVASVPFQEFFKRYHGLIGISGTLREVATEIHNVYGRYVVPVPSHLPSKREDISSEVFLDRPTQLQTMVDEVKRRNQLGQPVLVCTRSVEQSLGAVSYTHLTLPTICSV